MSAALPLALAPRFPQGVRVESLDSLSIEPDGACPCPNCGHAFPGAHEEVTPGVSRSGRLCYVDLGPRAWVLARCVQCDRGGA